MKRTLRILLPIAFVVLGLACAGLMMLASSGAEKTTPEVATIAVEVFEARPGNARTRVDATGTVQPARQVTITPEIAGRIVEVSPELMPGGRFEAGDTLARIDPRDFAIAVRAEQAALRQAELELELEQGRQETARREWEVLGGGRDASEAPLALRGPQLEVVEQRVEAARGALQRAEINLSRTRLRAPFDSVVVSEQVDVGQYVAPGSAVATLVGTRELWVSVSVPVERVGLLQLSQPGARDGSPAEVVQRLGDGRSIRRDGTVLRLNGQLEASTRTAQLLIAIEEPFREDGLPLLPGAYVDVRIEGRSIPGAFAIPQVAIYDGDTVWIADDQDRLASRTVEVVWGDERVAVLRAGLEDGDRVVTTPLALPLEGTPLDIQRSVASLETEAE